MNRSCVFDPALHVFKHHFAGNPVVPGAMLLDHHVAHGTTAVGGLVNLSGVRFQQAVRPGSPAEFVVARDGTIQVRVAGALCCAFDIDWQGSRSLPQLPHVDGPLRRARVPPLRDSAYWFLSEDILVDGAGDRAVCDVDLEDLESGHAWVGELDRWRPLMLIECAGNLAWALQHLRNGGEPCVDYVLARIDEAGYVVDCTGWLPKQTVIVHVRRYGALLVWDAWIADEVATRIAIRGAVSRIRKRQ